METESGERDREAVPLDFLKKGLNRMNWSGIYPINPKRKV